MENPQFYAAFVNCCAACDERPLWWAVVRPCQVRVRGAWCSRGRCRGRVHSHLLRVVSILHSKPNRQLPAALRVIQPQLHTLGCFHCGQEVPARQMAGHKPFSLTPKIRCLPDLVVGRRSGHRGL